MRPRDGFDPELFERLARLEPRSFWFRVRRRLIVSTLRKYFPNAGSLLEVGCGTGFILAGVRSALPHLRLVGTDLFAESLDIASRRLQGVELIQADAKRLPFREAFDVVGAFDVLEHIDEDEEALARLAGAVKVGGGLILLVPQHPWLWSEFDEVGHHRRRYTRRELARKITVAGFDVAFMSSFVSLLLPVLTLVRTARRLRPGRYDVFFELEPGALNGLLERMLDAERRLIERGISMPVGGSLLVVAKKRSGRVNTPA